MFAWLWKRLVPIPQIDSGSTYLFVGPHPDDIEIGCGATAAKLARLGKTVSFVVATDGGAGAKDPSTDVSRLVETRASEATASAAVLGARVRILSFPDAGRYTPTQLAEALVPLIQETKPDFVFAPDPDEPGEVHPDHLKLGKAVKEAVFLAANPLALVRRGIVAKEAVATNIAFYYTHRPNRIWTVSHNDVLCQWNAIDCHQSQFPAGASETAVLKRYLNLKKRLTGLKRMTMFADEFRVVGTVHQHCFSETETD